MMMSHRAVIAAGSSSKPPVTKPSICSVGPPLLMNSVPARRAGSVARCLTTAMLIIAPRGSR